MGHQRVSRHRQLCGQFKLPHGAPGGSFHSWPLDTAMLATFLEVLEQEATERSPPPAHQPAAPGVPLLPSGKTWETFETAESGAAAATGPTGPGQLRGGGINVLAFGLPGTGKTHARCALGHRPGGSLATPSSFAPAYRLVQELLAQADLDLPRQLVRQLLPVLHDMGFPIRRESERQTLAPSSPNATSAGRHHVKPGLLRTRSLPTPWPPPRRLTGSCTTRNLDTSPATDQRCLHNASRPAGRDTCNQRANRLTRDRGCEEITNAISKRVGLPSGGRRVGLAWLLVLREALRRKGLAPGASLRGRRAGWPVAVVRRQERGSARNLARAPTEHAANAGADAK